MKTSTHIKEKIKSCFDKAATSYDNNCFVQKKCCENTIISLLKHKRHYDTVIDFACGTGVSTKYILDNIICSKLYGIDFSENLIYVAAKKFAGNSLVKFIVADFELPIIKPNHIDLIFCNMGLQWSLDITKTLNIFNGYLKKGGAIAFTIPVSGSLSELKKNYVNKFHNLEDINIILTKSGYQEIQVTKNTYTSNFDNQLDIIKHFKALGANSNMNNNYGANTMNNTKKIKDFFVNKKNNKLSYKIASFIAKKA